MDSPLSKLLDDDELGLALPVPQLRGGLDPDVRGDDADGTPDELLHETIGQNGGHEVSFR